MRSRPSSALTAQVALKNAEHATVTPLPDFGIPATQSMEFTKHGLSLFHDNIWIGDIGFSFNYFDLRDIPASPKGFDEFRRSRRRLCRLKFLGRHKGGFIRDGVLLGLR
jgi:hypothetical protein